MKRKTDSTEGRIFNKELLLKEDIVKAILSRFRYDIPPLFGTNLAFAFVAGGFAKGYAVEDQDIDMFICVRKYDEDQVKSFNEYYIKLHEEFDLVPDMSKPGELMTLGRLAQKIALVNARKLRPIIESYYEYEGLLWTEMLTGVRAAQIGDMNLLNQFVELCETLPQKWRHDVYNLIGENIDINIAKLPIHRLIKFARQNGYITYKKYGKGVANNVEEAHTYMKHSKNNK